MRGRPLHISFHEGSREGSGGAAAEAAKASSVVVDTIRVVVVDDNELICQGIVGLLRSQHDIEVVGEANSGRDAIELVLEARPDVVLMDIAMPGINGLDATRELSQRASGAAIVMLTNHERADYVVEALRAGASGYVVKGADVQELLEAIRVASREDAYFQHPPPTPWSTEKREAKP